MKLNGTPRFCVSDTVAGMMYRCELEQKGLVVGVSAVLFGLSRPMMLAP